MDPLLSRFCFFSRIRFDFWRIRFFRATRNRGSASVPVLPCRKSASFTVREIVDPLLSRFCFFRENLWRSRFFHATRNRGSASFPIFFRESALTFGESASFTRQEIVDPLLSRLLFRKSASFTVREIVDPLLSRCCFFSRIRFDLWRSRFFHATRNRGSASFPVLLFRKSALTCGEAASFTRREIVDPLLSRFCFVANPLLSLRTYIQWRCVGILYTSIYIYIYIPIVSIVVSFLGL